MCLVCLNVMIAKSEDVETKDTLAVLKIVNTELQTIVDSLFIYEKNMDYYDSSLVFYIDVQHRNDITLLSVGSFHKILKSGNEIGCLTIKNHIFIVSSNCETNLFKKTGCKKRYDFYEPLEQNEDGSEGIVIDIYEDDSYTQWNYRLINGKLIKVP